MRKHNGMRPQDIVILIQVHSIGFIDWTYREISNELHISQSEISESIHRSYIAGFLTWGKKQVIGERLCEFLIHGIKYVFPVQVPGQPARGMPTAESAPPINMNYRSRKAYVWKEAFGSQLGQSIEPLHPSVPEICKKDRSLYEVFALIDAIRVGKFQDKDLLEEQLKKRIF